MLNYTLEVEDVDTGDILASASDSVAEGELDTWDVTVSNGQPTASISVSGAPKDLTATDITDTSATLAWEA